MRGVWLILVLCAIGGACSAQWPHFEARIRTETGLTVSEFLQARNPSEARLIAEARHPKGTVLALHARASETGRKWFLARLSIDGVNLTDTAMVRDSGEARRLFSARYARGRIVSLGELRDQRGYALYQGTIHDAGRQSFRDSVLSTSPANARKAFVARYPEARISSVTKTN